MPRIPRGLGPVQESMAINIPAELRHSLLTEDGGPAWLASLDELAERAVHRWGLVLGDPFETGMAAWTTAATTTTGIEVVLKLSFPNRESRDEAAALAAWHGSGAVELIAADPGDHALLLPRLRPGTSLGDAALPIDEHLAIGAELLRCMATVSTPPGEPFQDLIEVATDLATITDERISRTRPAAPYPVDLGLCRHAVDLLRTLPRDAPRHGLAHGDFNPGNILCRTSSEPAGGGALVDWLAIDPKPVYGDLAYDLWPLLTQFGNWLSVTPDASELADRTRLVAETTSLDAGRIASWCTARSVASGLWAADRGWWTGFRGADGDLARAGAWAEAAELLSG